MKVELKYKGAVIILESDAPPFFDQRVIDAVQCALDGKIPEAKALIVQAGYKDGFIANGVLAPSNIGIRSKLRALSIKLVTPK